MIVLLSKKYKLLNYISLIHLVSNINSARNNNKINKEYYISILFCSYIIYNYYIKDNPKDIIILYNYINFFIECFLKSKNLFPYFFNNIILYILYSHYLPNKYKKNLIKTLKLKKYKKLNNTEYIINSKEINSIFEYQKITIKKSNLFEYKNPYFSIIIYCNELKYLEETLLSIINQKFQKYEVIILYNNED